MNKIQTNRKIDTKHEEIINKFLFDNYFTTCYDSAKYIYDCEDRETQILGVDVIVNNKMMVDIKAQSSPKYVNNPTSTYILEISFLNAYGELCEGWFVNNNLKTTHDAFVWINSAETNERGFIENADDIHQVEVMVVDVAKLKEYVFSLADKFTLIKTANELRERGIHKTFVNGLKIVCSENIAEKPATIVMSKEVLKKYAVSDCILTVNGDNVSLKEV